MEHENNGDTDCNWCARYNRQKIGTGNGRRGGKRTSGDHRNDTDIMIGPKTKMNP